MELSNNGEREGHSAKPGDNGAPPFPKCREKDPNSTRGGSIRLGAARREITTRGRISGIPLGEKKSGPSNENAINALLPARGHTPLILVGESASTTRLTPTEKQTKPARILVIHECDADFSDRFSPRWKNPT